MNGIEVGKECICVDDKGTIGLKKDSIYTVKAMRVGCCSIQIDVGLKNCNGSLFSTTCGTCHNKIFNGTDSTLWYRISRFAPLADISELIELLNHEHLEKTI